MWRAVPFALAAISLALVAFAQDALPYGSNFPAQPNAPTALRTRPAQGLAPAPDPMLLPIPQDAPIESPPRPEFPPLPFPENRDPRPAPSLLPPPAWPRERVASTGYATDPAPEPNPAATAPPVAGPAAVTAPPLRPTTPIKLPPPGRNKPEAGESSPASARSSGWSGSIVTVITSLAIVLGLFAVAIWLMRRGLGGAASQLPSDAVAVLGQLPLTGRQQILLVRIGPKLLLVSTNGETSTTLTEIETPDDVDRIVGLCAESQPNSTTQTFRSLLAQMSTEPAAGGFLGDSHRHTRDLASSGAPARDD